MRASFYVVVCSGYSGGAAMMQAEAKAEKMAHRSGPFARLHGSDTRLTLRAATDDICRQITVILLQHHVESPQLMQVFEHLMA